jgi:hypothetical protein
VSGRKSSNRELLITGGRRHFWAGTETSPSILIMKIQGSHETWPSTDFEPQSTPLFKVVLLILW